MRSFRPSSAWIALAGRSVYSEHEGVMDLAGAETGLYGRFKLACAAATTAGLPGMFATAEVRGLRVVMTTAPGLGFLNSVTGLNESSAVDLMPLLDDLQATGVPSPCVVTGPMAPESRPAPGFPRVRGIRGQAGRRPSPVGRRCLAAHRKVDGN